ncbi:MAG TPA: hypothetical protein QF555_04110 [Candidatus Thalassarchaeaceae archaeon]|nr:hypothetical protein [Candidatus Thalassarchaeaceae archaeon]
MWFEGDLLRQLSAIILLLAPCLWMADRFLSHLDPARTDAQRLLIVPGISLFLMLGIIGWSVLIFNELRLLPVLFLWGLMEIGSRKITQSNEEKGEVESPWERLETEIERAQRRENPEQWEKPIPASEKIQWEFSTADFWILIASCAGIIGLMLPHFLFIEPLGIDWIGFATLADTLESSGTTNLPPPSIGKWTYPPALPSTAAVIMAITGIDSSTAVSLIGHLGLGLLCASLAGVFTRFGAGGSMLVSMTLSAGLFAKMIDSGYPSVLSQLGLILGLLVVMNAEKRSARQDSMALISVAAAGVIHPSGAMYLILLIMGRTLVRANSNETESNRNRVILGSSLVIGVSLFIAAGVFAPRVQDVAILAEYGWQGGFALIKWNGPLIPFAIWGAWRSRNSLEGRLLLSWLLLLWILSLIHLLEGIVGIGLLTLVSYILYSMSMHGFHIPLAALGALGLAPSIRLRMMGKKEQIHEQNEGEIESRQFFDSPSDISPFFLQCSFAICASLLLLTIGWFTTLHQHPELWVRTDGDRMIHQSLELPDDAIVFVENRPWGYLLDVEGELQRTAFPNLGLIKIEERIQFQTYNAILNDDFERLSELGITHAITSPRGEVGFLLATSNYWSMISDQDGSRIWEFHLNPTAESTREIMIYGFEEKSCNAGCDWRASPWTGLYDWPEYPVSENRVFLSDGSVTKDILTTRGMRSSMVRVSALIEAPPEQTVSITAYSNGNSTTIEKITEGSVEMVSTLINVGDDGSISILIDVDTDNEAWLNPTGVSGRGDRLIDSNGVWVHWLEISEI